VRIRARTTTIHPPTISSANVSRGFRGGCYSFAPKPRNDKNIKEDRTVTTVGRHFKSAEFPPKISISIPLRRRSQEVKKSGRQRGAGYTRLLSFFLSLSLSKGSLVVVICALGDARERERERERKAVGVRCFPNEHKALLGKKLRRRISIREDSFWNEETGERSE